MPAFHSSLPVVCFSAFRRLRSLVRVACSLAAARREGILDETLYNAPRSEGGLVPEALYEEQVADEPKRLQVADEPKRLQVAETR